jgi:hypothetical protein
VSIGISTSIRRFSVRIDLPSVAGKTFGTNGDDNTQVGFWLPAGVTFNLVTTMWQLEESDPLSSSDITGNGGFPTPFEHRGSAVEDLRVCEFYEASFVQVVGNQSAPGDTFRAWSVRFRAQKLKSNPVMTFTSSGSPITIQTLGVNGFFANCNQGDTTTGVAMGSWIADGRV